MGKLVHYAQVLGIPGGLLWFKLPNHHNSRHGCGSTASIPNLERLFSSAITVVTGRDDGRILAEPLNVGSRSQFLSGFGRGLLIVQVPQPDGTDKHYGLDRRTVTARISAAIEGAPLVIPRAFEIDDFTLGLLWAVRNLDDPLLDDDAALATAEAQFGAYLKRPSSFADSKLASGLSPVSRMWLGSAFCARHINRHLRTLQTPKFWTRERRGEEACTWLLFKHKYRYLEHTKGLPDDDHARTFCVPSPAVSSSPRFERTLLLLAVALNESFGIRVDVCTEPEYTAMPGFVLDSRGYAIVANWLHAESIWTVDMASNRVTVREFRDAIADAHAHSITTGADPLIRMRTMASYLDIDWEWFAQRCSALSQYGAAGLAQPRSRLLSLAGVDRACGFVADLTNTARQAGRRVEPVRYIQHGRSRSRRYHRHGRQPTRHGGARTRRDPSSRGSRLPWVRLAGCDGRRNPCRSPSAQRPHHQHRRIRIAKKGVIEFAVDPETCSWSKISNFRQATHA